MKMQPLKLPEEAVEHQGLPTRYLEEYVILLKLKEMVKLRSRLPNML